MDVSLLGNHHLHTVFLAWVFGPAVTGFSLPLMNGERYRHLHEKTSGGLPASGSRIAWPLRWIANPVVSHLGSSNLCRATSLKEVVKFVHCDGVSFASFKNALQPLALLEDQW